MFDLTTIQLRNYQAKINANLQGIGFERISLSKTTDLVKRVWKGTVSTSNAHPIDTLNKLSKE